MHRKKIAVLTGAGMSADSGIATFRDSGGLWEGADVMEVASVDGWYQNPEKVLEFYNQRRRQLEKANPNAGHRALADLETVYDVTVITQNVDNLHERGGSSDIIHLHGELTKVRPDEEEGPVMEIGYADVHMGDTDEKGRQFRPHIVWFGEMVPMMEVAADVVSRCDILIIIGTSLLVYPAAGLVNMVSPHAELYVIDRVKPDYQFLSRMTFIEKSAAEGTPELVRTLLNKAGAA